MKKILTAIAALAMVAGLASCQKENIAGNGNGEISKTTITATFAEPSKVTYSENGNDLQPSWESSDKVLGLTSGGKTFTLEVTSINGNVATLQGSDVPEGSVKLIYVSGISSAQYDSDNKKYVISYNGQKGDKTMPAIMTASGTIDHGCGEFTFDNNGAVLGLYSVGTALNGKAIKQVTVYGKKLASSANVSFSGVTFNYANDGYNVISTKVLGDITVGGDGALNKNILMAVPAEAEVDSVFIRTTEGEVYSLGSSNKDPMAAGTYRYIKSANFKRDAYRDAMILTGVFSVAADKQVFFSKGNLYAKKDDGGAWKWHFYDEQYKYNSIETSSGNRRATDTDTEIDLFTWGYNATYSVKPTGIDYVGGHDTEGNEQLKHSTDGDDWGVAYCNSNKIAVGTWRTLSTEEWQYLFNGRDNASNLYKYGVTVCGVTNCVVIAPDGWDLSANSLQSEYSSTSTPMTWEQAETAGLVCLPAAGSRNGNDVSDVGGNGRYWSSTAYGCNFAYCVRFTSGDVFYFRPDSNEGRYIGFSVRLITECK